jgi:hypothetical protein
MSIPLWLFLVSLFCAFIAGACSQIYTDSFWLERARKIERTSAP